MNAKAAVGVAVLGAVVLLGIWFYAGGNSASLLTGEQTATSSPTPPPVSPSSSAKPKTPIKGGSTYTSLLTQKGNYQCDYDQVQSTGQSHNVIYISDGKMRTEFRTMSGNVTTATLSVYDGHFLYSWKEGASVGTKSAVTSLGQLPAAVPQDLTSGKIYGSTYESVGWKCHTWLVNKALLIPPTYVVFS